MDEAQRNMEAELNNLRAAMTPVNGAMLGQIGGSLGPSIHPAPLSVIQRLDEIEARFAEKQQFLEIFCERVIQRLDRLETLLGVG